jgi:hypothetical protein
VRRRPLGEQPTDGEGRHGDEDDDEGFHTVHDAEGV